MQATCEAVIDMLFFSDGLDVRLSPAFGAVNTRATLARDPGDSNIYQARLYR